ncbi:PQQ-dependent sugar dehydrogenase [Actinosynnema pretiosum]|uniref:Glucose dehydrogenase n=1 Tax=Actinosynnema pretiosum TaxID=42197 RepID=A0A290Z0E0_9PSEU|nr:PQQ-dependent sugar dehydrogenase [Actinosynnema pretiosum]ATE52433.1 glucose dehydrogenase [Actinosynnema pretiosum]
MGRIAGFAAVLLVTGCTATPANGDGSSPGSSAPTEGAAAGLTVETVASGLAHPWGIDWLPDGRMLVTQRPGTVSVVENGQVKDLDVDTGAVARGEGGLLGIAVHPGASRFTTCQNTASDIRLTTWELGDGDAVGKVGDLLTGLPANPGGRHSGCRLAIDADGKLRVGTGDAARADTSQDRDGLGGKTLVVDLGTGEHRVETYGHRNVQGIAVRSDGLVVSAEHGPSVDDELNVLKPGANYGWDPSRGGTQGGYDESVPMTDLERFPDAVPAIWSSGSPTEAVSDAAFLQGEQWGGLDGALAVTALKGSKLFLFEITPEGGVHSVSAPPELDGTKGRLRAAKQGPDGALYVTTSNGDGDEVLRVTAAG